MTYSQFKTKWLGKRVDYDGVYQYQCVDLIKQYAYERFGIRAGAWGNAIDYARSPAKSFTDQFTKVSSPQQGDIVVYSGGTYGHIAIVDSTNSTSILSLEQNGATGDGDGQGGDEIRVRWIPKSRVAAYYRHKSLITQGVNEVANRTQVNNIYKAVLHRNGDEGGLNTYTGQDANAIIAAMLNSTEFKNHQNFVTTASKQISDLQTALRNEQNKPPQVVTKEVEKIVEKIVEVEVPVEVIKEVPAEVDEQEVVQNWFIRLWNSLFNRNK